MPARKFSVGKEELQDFHLEEWKEVVAQNPIAQDGRAMSYRENQGVLRSASIPVGLQGIGQGISLSGSESGEGKGREGKGREGKGVRNFELQLP